MKFAHQADGAGDGRDLEPHLPKDAILAATELLEFRCRTIPEKVPQDVVALAAIQNKIQLGIGDFASERPEKLTPGLAMRRMTVDENSVHVKDDAEQLCAHEVSPGKTRWDASAPGS